MQQDQFKLDDAIAMLAQTPAQLSALLAGVPKRWARPAQGGDEWSPYEVIAHLINGERTNWLPRARHILAGEQRPFEPFDRTPQVAEGHAQSVDDLLALFAELRRANVAALAGLNLTDDDLRRTGLHPEFGEVRLGQLLATWVVHDLNHIGQIVAALAQEYGEAVGPWRAYLAILDEGA